MIKAIETQYKGYRFRSRLEARWAVFFDELGVKWDYEVEGFDLTEQATWVIDTFARATQAYESLGFDALYRPGYEHEAEVYRSWDSASILWMRQQIERNQKLLYLPDFYLPDLKKYIEIKPYLGEGSWGNAEHSPIKLLGGLLVHGMPGEQSDYEVMPFYDQGYFFGYCPICSTFGYGFYAWAERICTDYRACGHYQKQSLDETLPFRNAIKAARSARFEHGERPV